MLRFMEFIYIILLGFVFANAFKVVDLIDEHKWIGGKIGFATKYISAILTILSIYTVLYIK